MYLKSHVDRKEKKLFGAHMEHISIDGLITKIIGYVSWDVVDAIATKIEMQNMHYIDLLFDSSVRGTAQYRLKSHFPHSLRLI